MSNQDLTSKMSVAHPSFLTEADEPGFRDHINTISISGKRAWVYPQKPNGVYYRFRTLLSYVLMLFFVSGPLLRWNGHPLFLFDILNRKFIIFGLVFWPQDFYLIVIGLLSCILFIVLFTSIFGRVFCGYACPQTIFMEMLFRKIEYWIEGDASKQMELDRSPWTQVKIFKKVSKLLIFYVLSFFIANVFLSYVIGIDELLTIITEHPSKHFLGLCMIVFFSFIFFLVFARFREQVCHFACPYGRFQSVLVDTKTIGVTYDSVRGETRATYRARHSFALKNLNFSKETLDKTDMTTISKAGKFGDCVNCGMCVKVCPAGIDIRNGIQLECIQCAACIDACDHVMEQIGLPKGLVRYTSIENIHNKVKKIFTSRHMGYAFIFFILLSCFITLLLRRSEIEALVLREPGTLYQKLPNGEISNLYQIKLFNKTFQNKNIDLKLYLDDAQLSKNVKARLQLLNTEKELRGQSFSLRRFLLILPKEIWEKGSTNKAIQPTIIILENGKIVTKSKTIFIAPDSKINDV